MEMPMYDSISNRILPQNCLSNILDSFYSLAIYITLNTYKARYSQQFLTKYFYWLRAF